MKLGLRLSLDRGIRGIGIGGLPGTTVPGAPTIGTATVGPTSASVTFTPPASDGGSPITSYTVTSSPGGFTASGPGSPLVVSGLSNGTAYTFTVRATNAIGQSAPSAASNSVTPTNPNLLVNTQRLEQPAWTNTFTGVTPNTITAPDSTLTADTVDALISGDYCFIKQTVSPSVGVQRVHSLHVKRLNCDWIWFTPFNDINITWFNTATGLFGTVAPGTTATVDTLAGGWYRIKLAVTTTSTTQASVGFGQANNSPTAVAGNAVYVWGAQLEAGTTATPYQAVA